MLEGTFDPGVHTVLWDGKNSFGDIVANDIYLVVLKTDVKIYIKKIAVIKGQRLR